MERGENSADVLSPTQLVTVCRRCRWVAGRLRLGQQGGQANRSEPTALYLTNARFHGSHHIALVPTYNVFETFCPEYRSNRTPAASKAVMPTPKSAKR
jgi:hypothetical protein